MPITPEHLSVLSAYQMLWRSDAPDADVEAAFAVGFRDHRPGAPAAGVAEFAKHRKAALGALSGLSAQYEPIAGDGQRLAAHATVSGVHSGEFFGVAATGKTLRWREVHLFEVRDGRIAEHWMDAALLSAYLQMTGRGQPDAEPPRAVPSGLSRRAGGVCPVMVTSRNEPGGDFSPASPRPSPPNPWQISDMAACRALDSRCEARHTHAACGVTTSRRSAPWRGGARTRPPGSPRRRRSRHRTHRVP